jgi:hypothetical protein
MFQWAGGGKFAGISAVSGNLADDAKTHHGIGLDGGLLTGNNA